jgi:hypothetical protein
MRKKPNFTSNPDATTGRIDLARLRNMTDDEIDFSDIPRSSASDWKNAEILIPIDEETYREFLEFQATRRSTKEKEGTRRRTRRNDSAP